MILSPTRFPNGINTATVDHAVFYGNYPEPDPTHLFKVDLDFGTYVAGDWTVTETDAGATEALTDAANGRLLITNTAADDDRVTMQYGAESFLPATNRTIWFEAILQVSTATQVDWLIGLVVTDTTPLANSDGIYFRKDDGDTNIDFETNASSSASTAAAIATSVAATDIKLGFRVTGTSLVEYFVNGLKVGENTTTIPTTEMRVTFHLQNGDGNARTASIDKIFCAQTR